MTPSAFLLVLAALAPGAVAQTFQAPVGYGPVAAPRGIAVGDFDSDGWLDVAIASFTGASVAVFSGDGSGFAPPVSYPVPPRPIRLATGDVDGDGDLDVVAVHTATGVAVSVLRGNGDGTFGGAVAGPQVSPAPSAVALVDLDADGRLDLIVGAKGTPQSVAVHLYQGVGDGTFAPATSLAFTGSTGGFDEAVRDLAIGDVDGDDDPDVLVAASFQGTRVLMNQGAFAFTHHEQPSWWGSGTQGVDLADVDQDGTLDLFWIEDDGIGTGADLRHGFGNGLFGSPQTEVDLGSVDFLRFASLDGDGDPDFVMATNGFGGQAFLKHAFDAPGVDSAGWQSVTQIARWEALETADLDGDGFDEVLLSDSQNARLLVFWNVGCPAAGAVFGATPAAVPAVAWPPSELTVQGCALDAVTAATVGGVPTAFAVNGSGGALTLAAPQALPLGAATVELHGVGGSLATFAIDITSPPQPVLALEPAQGLSTSRAAALHVGAAPGDLAFFLFSPDHEASSLPALVELDVGNGFSSLFLLAVAPVTDMASVSLALATAGAPLGASVHFQAAVLEAAAPVLPLVTTNVVTAVVMP